MRTQHRVIMDWRHHRQWADTAWLCTILSMITAHPNKTEAKECFAFRIWVNKGENYLTEKNKKGVVKCLEKMGTRFEELK